VDEQQPTGQIDLYLSDLAGSDLPLCYCRPSANERDAGILRFVPLFSIPLPLCFSSLLTRLTIIREPQITVTYHQLRDAFLKARKIHRGEACSDDYAQESHSEGIARRIAEEMAQHMAEKHDEIVGVERERAKDKAEMAEMARRTAEMERERAKAKAEMAEMEREMARRMAEMERERAEVKAEMALMKRKMDEMVERAEKKDKAV
jgi:colicin import membrane protein